MTKRIRRNHWRPPPLAVGDRVKHLVKKRPGIIVKLVGTTATVQIGKSLVVVDVAGLYCLPAEEQIYKHDTKLLRESRTNPVIRRALGLPRFVGVRDQVLLKPPVPKQAEQ